MVDMTLEERLDPIAARERVAMEHGATLREVLRRLRDQDGLGIVEQHYVLRQIKRISFGIAKQIVFDNRELELDLDDLALLASVPHHCKALWWLPHRLDWAIVKRDPFTTVEPDDRAALLEALDDPAWRREIEIVSDDAAGVRVRFVRVWPRAP